MVRMGRVVKGARVTEQAYRLQPPSIETAPPKPPQPLETDPRFAELYEDAPAAVQPEPAASEIDLGAVQTEAARLIDDAAKDAEALVRDAQQRAISILAEAQTQAEALRTQAHREGSDKGLADGNAAAQAEMDEMLATMRGLIEMARAERHKMIEAAEPEIVRLAVGIAERILNRHVALEPATVVEMTKAAITRLVNRETVTVRVNPADVETMRDHRERLLAMNDIDNMRIIEDQRVDRGGVLMETDAGTIDSKISTQLREVRRLLAVDDAISVPDAGVPMLNKPAAAS